MAWIFELAIECGSQRDSAAALRELFDQHRFDLPAGQSGICVVRPETVQPDEEGNWWISVLPLFEGSPVVEASTHLDLLPGIASVLYRRLRSASGYRFALVGTETYQFNTLVGVLEQLDHPSLQGLVLRQDLYDRVRWGLPFEFFAPNYLWWPLERGGA